MDLSKVELLSDMIETLSEIFRRAKNNYPELNESIFFKQILMEWLEPYKQSKSSFTLTRQKVTLKNRLKEAIQQSGKSNIQIAKEIGVNRVYISQIISGRYEPTITIILLLAESIGYPLEKIKDLFYLEPMI